MPTAKGTRGLHRTRCTHPPTGTVAWPLELPDQREAHASVYSCFREPCIRTAADWVRDCTGTLGVYRNFPAPR